ncbi:hypothetical protein M7I_6334 [Glarea lozoyensis 74030]|uniref:Uncharacterized protein n=1 Tax=Glarea lozoyensis (strain ATCC 74030 / MF5533) TaxID=1104152 RepID=H0EUA2_GLAL7|nr:hypothetical protein M7I_6334 [Glarea lozoyensis 74030]
MRLWNLVTGKKAGVLNFERDILNEVGESKFTSGEGRKVAWGATDAGEEFCVGFDKGAVVYGMDNDLEAAASEKSLPAAKLIAILDADISPPDPKSTTDSASTRIKDFTILPLPNKTFIIPTARSDGTIQIFSVSPEDLLPSSVSEPKTVGKSLGSIKTGNRITCLKAFVMLPKYQGEEGEDGDEFEGFGDDVVDEEVGSSGSDSESSDEE